MISNTGTHTGTWECRFLFFQFATFTFPIIQIICLPKFCRSFVFHFSWVLQPSQEKSKTMLMQNFGGQVRCIIGNVVVAYRPCPSSKPFTFKTRLSAKPVLWKCVLLHENKKSFLKNHFWFRACLIPQKGRYMPAQSRTTTGQFGFSIKFCHSAGIFMPKRQRAFPSDYKRT